MRTIQETVEWLLAADDLQSLDEGIISTMQEIVTGSSGSGIREYKERIEKAQTAKELNDIISDIDASQKKTLYQTVLIRNKLLRRAGKPVPKDTAEESEAESHALPRKIGMVVASALTIPLTFGVGSAAIFAASWFHVDGEGSTSMENNLKKGLLRVKKYSEELDALRKRAEAKLRRLR